MEKTVYKVVSRGVEFFVLHEGDEAGPYSTKEAAFEAAVYPASSSIAEGMEVEIHVEGGMKDPLESPERQVP